jgi:hypothetical protein
VNTVQKVALVIGLIILLLVFGKTITRISFGVMGLFGKGIIIIAATIFIVMSLKNAMKKK